MDYHNYGCPIRFAAGVLGDRWSLVILRDLMFKKRQYYGDFLTAGEGISTNILANRLLKLEMDNVIKKALDPDHGRRYIYSLTDKGVALLPVLLSMMEWAAKFDDKTEMPKKFIMKLQEDPESLSAEILAHLHS
ncbi:MAG: helix-turn-helix transcriptional regulator [Granulosicoccus sp.]|nr:helix-turn-helix transcriptional regulator [Granulosicoccus sp.]